MKYSHHQTKYIGKYVGLRTYQHPCTYQITVYPFKLGYAFTTVPFVLRFHTIFKEWGLLYLAGTLVSTKIHQPEIF